MIEWILIDDDPRLIQTARERFADRPFVFLSAPNDQSISTRELIQGHPRAWVFLALEANALSLARQSILEWKRDPHTIRLSGDVPPDQVAKPLQFEMRASKIGYVERSRILSEIEELGRDRDARWLWAEADIRRQYAGQLVAVCDQIIWGNGPDLATALAVAESKPGCPPADAMYLESLPEIEECSPVSIHQWREARSAMIQAAISNESKAYE